MSNGILDTKDANEMSPQELSGVLVTYQDDKLNESVKIAIQRKSRVRYKCMDTFSNFLAFGTSGGAIYLYKLESVTHSSCTLISMIPCDQGSIEVIKFLPNPQTDDLLVAIGTSRGSLVVFKLSQLPGELNPICNEIYKADSFTHDDNWSQNGIKFIECDQDLFDPSCSFTKLYICDTANRLYVLESNIIYKQTMRLFRQKNHKPTIIFSVNDSNINQISVHRSQLLISTNLTTRLFDEQSNQLSIIGSKKRKEGFYGACFLYTRFKPMRILQVGQPNPATQFASTTSINDLENLLIFVSRPMFRLWQVNHHLSVMFTHQFEPRIKASRYNKVVELQNVPIGDEDEDDPLGIIENFTLPDTEEEDRSQKINSDHFEKLLPIYSSTLGNLLLSYTQNELFIVDPITAELIVWHSQQEPIIQVCCNENEIFIWSTAINDSDRRQFQLKRLVLLAPTQFVLELHRLHRYSTLVAFVELFCELFRKRMALPLTGSNVITTEGGLLRNVLLNAWDVYTNRFDEEDESCEEFKTIVEEILDESKQLRHSLENLTDSRFFLTMTNENIDRLCSEPYASLVSLQVSIVDLHTNHLIHFSKEALNRHKSVASLSLQTNKNGNDQTTKSNYDLSNSSQAAKGGSGSLQKLNDNKVIVERQRPKRLKNRTKRTNGSATISDGKPIQTIIERVDNQPYFSVKGSAERASSIDEIADLIESAEDSNGVETMGDENVESARESLRCASCQWPRARSHLRHLDSSQQVQLKWIDENLLSNFEENINQIVERAFKHGLWRLYLKCLAFKDQLDDYIICCMMLDDVRLLDIEQFVITHCGDDQILDSLLVHLSRKVNQATSDDLNKDNQIDDNNKINEICMRCGIKFEPLEDNYLDDLELQQHPDDRITFNLVNLFEQIMTRRNADMKKVVSCLLNYPKLLNNSKIPATFYLKAITTATNSINQAPLNRARFAQLPESRGIALL